MFAFVAALVTESRASALTVWVEMFDKLGATFTSRTITRKVLVALSGGEPLSVTATETVFVEGLLVCCGVQVITPALVLNGEMVMPFGAAARLKVKLWAGRSASVAVLVILSVVNSLTKNWLVAGVTKIGRAFSTLSTKNVG